MKGKITKLFRPEGILDINKEIEIDDQGKVLDKNGNGYVKIPYFGNVTKVELAGALDIQPWMPDADNLSNTAFMTHKAEGANALLREENGAIVEALFECMKN